LTEDEITDLGEKLANIGTSVLETMAAIPVMAWVAAKLVKDGIRYNK
jgi:hypothetical protein